jgi:hypothetical protein
MWLNPLLGDGQGNYHFNDSRLWWPMRLRTDMATDEAAQHKMAMKMERLSVAVRAMLTVTEIPHRQCLFVLGEAIADVLHDGLIARDDAVATLDWLMSTVRTRLNELYSVPSKPH